MISRTCFIHWPFLYIYMVLWYNSTIIWFLVLISHIKQQSYAILSIKLRSYDYEYIFIYIQKNIIVGKNFKNIFTYFNFHHLLNDYMIWIHNYIELHDMNPQLYWIHESLKYFCINQQLFQKSKTTTIILSNLQHLLR